MSNCQQKGTWKELQILLFTVEKRTNWLAIVLKLVAIYASDYNDIVSR